MKTHFRGLTKKVLLATAVSFVLLLLSGTTSAQWSGSTNIYYNSGNVGIGTTSPISGGGGASWLTINGSSYSGGVVYGVSGTAKGYTYYDNSVGAMSMQSASGVPLALTINGTSALFIDTSRNVGIGTTSPGGLLHVATTSASDTFRLQYNNGSNGGNWTINPFISGVSNGGLSFLDSQHSTVPLVISDAGNVGIGKTNPSEKLEVVGNINVSGSGAGNIYLSGTINAKYQDVAEWVPSSEQNPVGTVVVLDSTRSNQVISSTQAYDTRVAGVVSEKPGIALGESGANKVLVATTGRVLVKVDASNGPIHIGDLLVTSDIPGLAMKSEPITIGNRKMHMPGTLIGKALEPLEKGSGKILVLLSLQ